jgi:hypothetical protein
MKTPEVAQLLEEGATWTSILTAVLESHPADKRVRMVLFRELLQLFDVRVETLSIIGGWNYWPDGCAYNDEELNSKLQGKLVLRKLPDARQEP